MKKILFSLIGATLFTAASAQLTNYSVGQTAPNWQVTDVHGNAHDLYDITSGGQYVLIDFFFTACGPCQSTAPIVTSFYQNYGCNSGDVFVISMDNGDSDADVLAYESTYAGANSNPSVSGTEGGGDAVNADYGPTAYPTVVLIGPDNKFINIDIWPIGSVGDIEAAFPGGAITPAACGSVGMEDAASLPTEMQGVYPNPAVKEATVDFSLGRIAEVSFEIYDMLGKKVQEIDAESFGAGIHSVKLPVATIPAGNYFVNMVSDREVLDVTKLVVIK